MKQDPMYKRKEKQISWKDNANAYTVQRTYREDPVDLPELASSDFWLNSENPLLGNDFYQTKR